VSITIAPKTAEIVDVLRLDLREIFMTLLICRLMDVWQQIHPELVLATTARTPLDFSQRSKWSRTNSLFVPGMQTGLLELFLRYLYSTAMNLFDILRATCNMRLHKLRNQ